MGYTPQLVVGVWVGNASNKPMKNAFGARGAGFIWHEFMDTTLKGQPALQFARPDGLVRASVDAKTGLQAVAGRPSVTDWFIAGTLPTQSAPQPTPTPAPPTTTPLPATPTALPTPSAVPTAATSSAPVATNTPLNPNFVAVPNLVGLTEADAHRLINQAGLMTTYTNYQTINDVPDKSYFNSIPAGHVLSQLPPPGSSVPKGSKVYIAVRKQ